MVYLLVVLTVAGLIFGFYVFVQWHFFGFDEPGYKADAQVFVLLIIAPVLTIVVLVGNGMYIYAILTGVFGLYGAHRLCRRYPQEPPSGEEIAYPSIIAGGGSVPHLRRSPQYTLVPTRARNRPRQFLCFFAYTKPNLRTV